MSWGVAVQRTARDFSLFLGALAVALLAGELVSRVVGLDRRLTLPCLRFQGADLTVHQISNDPFLHYELKPGSRFDLSSYHVTIDASGARLPTHPAVKAPGVFRVLCFGGSTMYGANVGDDQTIAARFEARLNQEAGQGAAPRFEAWNFGTSAYTMGQVTHLARTKLDTLSPDLIVIQMHNRAQRAFLLPEDQNPRSYPWDRFPKDPVVFREYFSVPPELPPALVDAGIVHSSLFRALVAATHRFVEPGPAGWAYADEVSSQEAAALSQAAEARGVPVVFVTLPPERDQSTQGADKVFPGLAKDRYLNVYQQGREPAFFEIHPPAAILDEWAGLLIQGLRGLALLPAAPKTP